MDKLKVVTTIGPSSNKPEVLRRLKDRGVDFFRINLSHTEEQDIEQRIKDIKDYGVPIILDTEGSQVRSGNTSEIEFKEGEIVKLYGKKIDCDSSKIWLNPVEVINSLVPGDLISIDFNSLLLKVIDNSNVSKQNYLSCLVLIPGKIGGKKAVSIESPTFNLPAFSQKDRKAVALAKKYKINHFTLSFMESAEEVKEFKKMYPGAKTFSKIESRKGLDNYLEIAKESDGILIDRGDLSSQVPIERIPFIQKALISDVRKMGKQVFIATNTLEQMSASLKPNRAEVTDIVNIVLDGATGIALTKETAVGKYPVETVNMLFTILKQFGYLKTDKKEDIVQKIKSTGYLQSRKVPSLLIKPHGGVLVDRFAHKGYPQNKLPKKTIEVDEETLMDIEQIAIGAFSPIEGFMNEKDFTSVSNKIRLANGLVWPIPITLAIDEKTKNQLKEGEDALVVFKNDKQGYAIVNIEDIYKVDKKFHAKKIFGTEDKTHPGVKRFLEQGDYFVGGKITLFKRRNSKYKYYELTPSQTRKIFTERGWSKIVGFHTRNVIHRSHEFVQLQGLEKSNADGLFVHPVIGKKKSGDFEADVIIESYEKMAEKFYPKGKFLFSAFASYSRYLGPREALFTALVRKNFGCSHFIVGRDHTGVGNFYAPEASHKIFSRFKKEEISITPILFGKVSYSPSLKTHVNESELRTNLAEQRLDISGTEARAMFKQGKQPPVWFMRSEISSIILNKLEQGKKVFIE